MDKEYLQSLYTPDMQEIIFGDRNYFNNQNTNKLPFSIADLAAKNANVDLFPSPQEFYTSPTYLMKQAEKFNENPFRTGITSVIPFEQDPIAIQQGFVKGSPSDQGTNFQFLPSANEADETDEVEEKKPRGIAALLRAILSFAIPGAGFFLDKGRDALSGIQSLNQRLRSTDFAKSKTLADYFDARKYGGRDERDAAAARNMAQARGIQKKIDRGEFGTRDISIDRGRGSIPSRTTSAPRKSSSTYSAANRAFARGR